MAEWREFNATNKPETCKWCGNKLRWPTNAVGDFQENVLRSRRGEKVETARRYDKAGDYGDGHFCGLRCGYLFGEAMANNGRTLQPR